jgi:thiol-disulfide isomerase/thioredoxin
MAEKTSVVTPERFSQGMTYQQYVDSIKVNKDRFQQFYDSAALTAEDAEFFSATVQKSGAKALALSEDWCGDCYRNMPVIARISEASGMEVRVFARDTNQDIMSEYLKDGQYQSIPVLVFYTKDDEYIGHWIERPTAAYAEADQIAAAVRQEKPGASDEEVTQETRRRTQDRHVAWQQEVVREIRDLLSQKLGG